MLFRSDCGVLCKKWEIDHVIPDALHIEKKAGSNESSNAKLLCIECHKEKTANDVAVIAKAKRREAASLFIKKRTTLRSAGFPKSDKPKAIDKSVLPELPRRGLYQ